MSTNDVPGAKKENKDVLAMGCWAEHEDGSLALPPARRQPHCLGCGKFMAFGVQVPFDSPLCAGLYYIHKEPRPCTQEAKPTHVGSAQPVAVLAGA